MPMARAFAVIFEAKPDSVPPRRSPIAAAMSFAERVTSARIASLTAIVWPGFRPSFDGGWAAACFEMVMREERVTLPLSRASNSM